MNKKILCDRCLGASSQFYNYAVVNPAQQVLISWLNETYLQRDGRVRQLTDLNFVWSVVVSSVSIGSIIGALLNRFIMVHMLKYFSKIVIMQHGKAVLKF